jgi:hypothetical protein
MINSSTFKHYHSLDVLTFARKYLLKLKENAKYFPFSCSYAGRISGIKFANTEK